jgi:hypothetical protein
MLNSYFNLFIILVENLHAYCLIDVNYKYKIVTRICVCEFWSKCIHECVHFSKSIGETFKNIISIYEIVHDCDINAL